jgi:hypothetical protein
MALAWVWALTVETGAGAVMGVASDMRGEEWVGQGLAGAKPVILSALVSTAVPDRTRRGPTDP